MQCTISGKKSLAVFLPRSIFQFWQLMNLGYACQSYGLDRGLESWGGSFAYEVRHKWQYTPIFGGADVKCDCVGCRPSLRILGNVLQGQGRELS